MLSVTTLQAQAQNVSPVVITHFFLEPQIFSGPYSRIEIDLSSTDAFQSGNTPQRSISVQGQWGYCNNTIAAGTLISGLASDATVTTFLCSDASKVDVGDVLLIGTEAIYVSGRAQYDTTATLSGNPTVDKSNVLIAINTGSLIHPGEAVTVDAEIMYVSSVTANNLNLPSAGRAYDGSVLAAHTSSTHVYAPRTLTIVRGVNGTTAAVHPDSTAIVKYQAPADVVRAVVASAVAAYQQEAAGYGRSIGAGDMAVEFTGKAQKNLWQETVDNYQRARSAAI